MISLPMFVKMLKLNKLYYYHSYSFILIKKKKLTLVSEIISIDVPNIKSEIEIKNIIFKANN